MEVSPTEKKGIKIAAQNRKAFHDYFVEDRYEAGVELFGTEVKSIRAGTLNLKDAYCTIKGGELFVHGMHISPYEKGNIFNKDPVRTRRLSHASSGKSASSRRWSRRTAILWCRCPCTSGMPG